MMNRNLPLEHASFLLESTKHSLAVRLRIKEVGGVKAFVVDIYDPNFTHTKVRCETANLNDFASHQLIDYINNTASVSAQDMYASYFDEDISIFIPCSKALENLQDEKTEPSRVENPDSLPPTPSYIFHLMNVNATGWADEISEKLQKFDISEIKEILGKPVGPDGASSLYMALQDGNLEALKEWAKLFKLLPDYYSTDLLASKTEKGLPGLYAAMQFGRHKAIKEWGELLKLVSAAYAREELLVAKNENGVPCLHMAMLDSSKKVIREWGHCWDRFLHTSALGF
jgi:hypothetical protein